MPPILKVENVSKKYENNIQALREIALEIKEKEVLAVVGVNGSGKTTLFNIIAGLTAPTKGKVFIKNQEITNQSELKLAYIRRTDLGLIYPKTNLFSELSVLQNIEFPLKFTKITKKERENRVTTVLRKLGLNKVKNSNINNLAISDQIKVALARAIIHKPSLVMLDEPFQTIDIKLAANIIKQIKTLATEGTSFLIFTDNSEITKHTQRFVNIVDGKIGR